MQSRPISAAYFAIIVHGLHILKKNFRVFLTCLTVFELLDGWSPGVSVSGAGASSLYSRTSVHACCRRECARAAAVARSTSCESLQSCCCRCRRTAFQLLTTAAATHTETSNSRVLQWWISVNISRFPLNFKIWFPDCVRHYSGCLADQQVWFPVDFQETFSRKFSRICSFIDIYRAGSLTPGITLILFTKK